MDVGSANGTFFGSQRIETDVWHPLPAGAVVYLGDTTLTFEPGIATADTVAVAPAIPSVPPPSAPPSATPSLFPWVGFVGAVALVLLIIVGAILWAGRQTPAEVESSPDATPTRSSLVVQTPGAVSGAESPTLAEPLIPYPVIVLQEVKVRPVILGALPDPNKAFIIVRVRVENQGTTELIVSPDQFQLLDASGLVLNEIGNSYSEAGLRKLGLPDRYQDLRLRPGGSVPESLLFTGEARAYQFFLRYEQPGLEPITLDLGVIDAGREVALALGTPLAEESPVALAQATASLTAVPPTPTRPAAVPAPRRVPTSSLVGTIAYPVFNGTTYDLYFGNSDGSGTGFFLAAASQPQFSPDGGRIAYHSWQPDKRGLVTVNVGGGNEHIVSANLEDQLPTWAPDGETIIFLSRRSGQRASELFTVSSVGGEARVIGNGEYPTWGSDGRLVFKGWETTGVGLRISQPELSDVQELTSDDTDTAPSVSPDGEQIAFMSRRDGNWNIYVVNNDGTELRQLTDDAAQDGLPSWSPDGQVIAFVSDRGGPWAVWAVTPNGGGKRQLFTMEGSPDGFVEGEDSDKSRGWGEERISWTR
jgi:TolB protein